MIDRILLTVDFDDDEQMKDALVYVCGRLEGLVRENILKFGGPGGEKSDGQLLADEGRELYEELINDGYGLTADDAIAVTIAIVEAQKAQSVINALFENTRLDMTGGDLN